MTSSKKSGRRLAIPHFIKVLALAALITFGVLGARARGGSQTPPCIRSWPEIRYSNYAYDHIVHISNDCRVKASCAVSSDVNPEPVQVIIPAGEQIEVMTTRGSQAHEFTPNVECRFLT
jgi:hypothetical protein